MTRHRWGEEAGRGYEAGFIPLGKVAPCQDQEWQGGPWGHAYPSWGTLAAKWLSGRILSCKMGVTETSTADLMILWMETNVASS